MAETRRPKRPGELDTSTVVALLAQLHVGQSEGLLLHTGQRPGAQSWTGDIDLLVSTRPQRFLEELSRAAASLGFSVVLQAPRVFTTLEIAVLFPDALSWTAIFVNASGSVLHLDVAFISGPLPESTSGTPHLGLPEVSRELGLTYLILKRIRKGDHTPESWRRIHAFARGAEPRVRPYLGARVAEAVSEAIAGGIPPDAATIRRAQRALRRRRALSIQAIRAMASGGGVAWRRVQRPAGIFIALGGVDGSGKSTMTDALAAWSPFRRVRRLHSRPGLLKPPGWFLGRQPSADPDPHAAAPWGRAMSTVRLVYFWADFVVGYWLRIWPVRARGGMVVSERWWWDMYVDPQRHRLSPMPYAARALGQMVPRPDVFFVLDAPGDCIRHRKRELEEPEIERQRAAWFRLAPVIANLRMLPVAAPATDVADAAVATVCERQRQKISRRLGKSSGLVAWPRAEPRWLIDPGNPDALRAGLRLYVPSRRRAVLAAKGAAVMAERTRWGRWALSRSAAAPGKEAEQALEWVFEAAGRAVPARSLRVTGYLGSPGPLRKISAVVTDECGSPVLFAKLGATALAEEALRHEAEVLGGDCGLVQAAVLPRVVSLETDDRGTLLLLSPVAGSRLDNQAPLTERHISVIAELSRRSRRFDGTVHREALMAQLDRALDTAQSRFLRAAIRSTGDTWPALRTAHFAHGDLTPWNCLECGRALGIVDWEMAGYRIAGWDLLHYLVQIQTIAGNAVPVRAADHILRSSLPTDATASVLSTAEIDLPGPSRWPAVRLLGLIEGAVNLLTTQPELSPRGIAVRIHAIAQVLGIPPPARECR